MLAAEAADLDILWSFAGPVEELKTPSRHYPHLHCSARGGRCSRGRRVALAPLARGAKTPQTRRPAISACRSRRARPQAAAAGQLVVALPDGVDRSAEPPAAGLDQQLRPTPLLSLQPALVCGQLRVYCRTRDVGLAFAGVDCAGVARAHRSRKSAGSGRHFVGAAGPFLRSREWFSFGVGVGPSTIVPWRWSIKRRWPQPR